MAKKHKTYKPQRRSKLKPTTGQLILTDVLYMDREKDEEGKYQVYSACTCGKWRSSKGLTSIQKVALEAKAHADETGHRLRFHQEDGKSEFEQQSDKALEESLQLREEVGTHAHEKAEELTREEIKD